MKIVIAEPTGPCSGVTNAIRKLEDALARYGTVYSLGAPIHNPQEVERLRGEGMRVAESVSDVPAGAVAFVRTHGAARRELEDLYRDGRVVVDGTCPFVRNAQKKAGELSEMGYKVFVVGEAGHAEVRGILGHASGDVEVVSSERDIADGTRIARAGVLSQTTQTEASLVSVAAKLVLLADEIKVYNTICRATIERQESIKRLAGQVDCIIVIGGRDSANTRKLVEISESFGTPTHWVERPEEIERRWARGRQSIGVAAGGSTPDWLINELIGKLKRL
jgi:4-hydroxy-3-methylbut-2-enyl diphosphate reductase